MPEQLKTVYPAMQKIMAVQLKGYPPQVNMIHEEACELIQDKGEEKKKPHGMTEEEVAVALAYGKRLSPAELSQRTAFVRSNNIARTLLEQAKSNEAGKSLAGGKGVRCTVSKHHSHCENLSKTLRNVPIPRDN